MTIASGTSWGNTATAEKISQPDDRIHGYWLISPLASYLIWAVFAVVLWIGEVSGASSSDLGLVLESLGVLGLLTSGFAAYLVYALVNRCNKHYARSELFYWTTLEGMEAGPAHPNVWVSARTAQESVSKLIHAEHQRSALFWALLCMIPLAGWVFLIAILWMTSRGFRQHAQLEGPVIEDVDRTLRTSGSTGIVAGTILTPSRDILGYSLIIALIAETIISVLIGLGGYLVLAYLTIGGLSVVWLDLTVSDPTAHFRNHSRIEME